MKRIGYILAQVLLTLAGIMVLSFLILELAAGDPLATDKRVSPSIAAAEHARLGLAVLVRASYPCKVTSVVKQGTTVSKDSPLLRCEDGRVIASPSEGKVIITAVGPGEAVEPGKIVAALQHPWYKRLLSMLLHMSVFDFGVSLQTRGTQKVRDLLVDGAGPTLRIGLLALVLAVLTSLFTTLLPPTIRRFLDPLALFVLSLPVVVAAPLFLYLVCFKAGLLPLIFDSGPSSYIGPVLILGGIYWAALHRVLVPVVEEARAAPHYHALMFRGVGHLSRLLHLLRSQLIALSGLFGPYAAGLLTGSLVVEEVFHIPGIARYFVSAALNRDYPLLLGTVYLYAVILVLLNALSDLAILLLDPRVRRGR